MEFSKLFIRYWYSGFTYIFLELTLSTSTKEFPKNFPSHSIVFYDMLTYF